MALADVARRESVAILLGKVLDQSGYLRDLREDKRESIPPEGRLLSHQRTRIGNTIA